MLDGNLRAPDRRHLLPQPDSRAQGYECCGVRFALRVGPGTTLAAAGGCLPPGSIPVDAAPMDAEFTLGLELDGNARAACPGSQPAVFSAPATTAGLDLLESAIRFHVAVSAPSLVFVHAGVVGWRGQAIVVPGRSGAGKSTLVEALVRAGAEYYSDEYAVIDRMGSLHPFPKPLSLATAATAVKTRVDVRTLGGRAGTRPLRIGQVADVRYVADASWEVTPLTPAGCVLALLARTVRAQIDPANSLDVLTRSLRLSTGWSGIRDAADRAAARILCLAEPGPPEEDL